MNLKELKTRVDFALDRLKSYENPEDIPVLITLSETSMGARAFAHVKYASLGTDWERGQFRLEAMTPLASKGNRLEDVKPAVCKVQEGKNLYVCPRCIRKISKTDAFCKHCGQKLK